MPNHNEILEAVEAVMDALMKSDSQEMWEDRVGESRATREAWRPDAEAIVTALLPLEVTDESPLRVTVDTADLIELLYGATTDSPANRKARTRLRAALTQKGEPRACTGCANGCAGCKGKGKPYGEELMRQLRQGQKGDNE